MWKKTATEVVSILQSGKALPVDLIDEVQSRIEETDRHTNAIPILCLERARSKAAALSAQAAPCIPGRGNLYGLPILVKDTSAVKGVRFTCGSLLFEDRTADENDPMVDMLEAKGAIIVGKTNTPEFAAGANTFNSVFGTTLNPWDTRMTCGGSSGGSAAALAAGQVWLATGSDLGGSLRIPASFCGVVGLRPSVGVVPFKQTPVKVPAQKRLLPVNGPLARNVPDLALFLDAMAGQHPDDPLSRPPPAASYSSACDPSYPHQCSKGLGWSADLGIATVEPEVVNICRKAVDFFQTLGLPIKDDCPDLTDSPQVFQVLRGVGFQHNGMMALLREPMRSQVKHDLVWQLEFAQALTQQQVEEAECKHDAMLNSTEAFFERCDFLACPTAMVPPFDANTKWLSNVNGMEFDNYVEWLRLTSVISLLDVPALSLPCGLTTAGLPVGLQLIAKHGSEHDLLAAAAAFERAHPFATMVPLDPRQPAIGVAQL